MHEQRWRGYTGLEDRLWVLKEVAWRRNRTGSRKLEEEKGKTTVKPQKAEKYRKLL
jgi:hypothetical protein